MKRYLAPILLLIKNTNSRLAIKLNIKGKLTLFIIVFGMIAPSITFGRQLTFYPEYKVYINSTNIESTELALTAIKKAYDFFIGIGYSQTYFLDIVFQKEVLVKTRSDESIRVYGKLGKEGVIYLTEWNEPWLAGQNAYEMRMTKDFYESLIVHEVAHFITEKIAHRKVENILSEYIAYVVQFSQMPSKTRQTILSKHPLSSFESDEISLDIFMFDPAVFAVKSYLHFKKSKGKYLKKIVSDTAEENHRFAYWQFH